MTSFSVNLPLIVNIILIFQAITNVGHKSHLDIKFLRNSPPYWKVRKVKPEVSRIGEDLTLQHADQCGLSISGSGFHILGGSTCRQMAALLRRSGDSHEVLTLGRYLQPRR